jgi:N-dimethylarginine dimethylaminohydrolase
VDVLKKYEVNVFRPKLIKDYNQIFTRDIGFVIDNFFLNQIFFLKEQKSSME